MPFTLRQMCIWTQHANWWLLYQVPQGNLLYHYSTQAVNLGSILHGFTYRTVYRTLCFSVKCPSFLEHLSRLSCQYPSHLSHHWIILPSGHESWPLAYAFCKTFPLGIGLFFWVLFLFWIIIIGKLLPLMRWASIPSSDFLHHYRIPSPMHCFLVHVL